MKLGLDTIAGLGSKGNNKSAVLPALFATKARNSVLGTYGFDANGDTTLKKYGLYKVGPDGNPKFERTVRLGATSRRSGAAPAAPLHARVLRQRGSQLTRPESAAAGRQAHGCWSRCGAPSGAGA